MKRLLALVLCSLLASASWAERAEPIVNHDNLPFLTTSGKQPTAAEFKAAVARAGAARRWVISDGENNTLVATMVVRQRHTLSVTIAQMPTTFSVTYRDSINLNYGKSDLAVPDPTAPFNTKIVSGDQYVIHPNYNKWVRELVLAIRNELRRI